MEIFHVCTPDSSGAPGLHSRERITLVNKKMERSLPRKQAGRPESIPFLGPWGFRTEDDLDARGYAPEHTKVTTRGAPTRAAKVYENPSLTAPSPCVFETDPTKQ